MNKFNLEFDITEMSILKDALKTFGRIWQGDYYYHRRIKELYIYIGFDEKDFDNIKAAYSYDDIIKEIKNERESTKI